MKLRTLFIIAIILLFTVSGTYGQGKINITNGIQQCTHNNIPVNFGGIPVGGCVIYTDLLGRQRYGNDTSYLVGNELVRIITAIENQGEVLFTDTVDLSGLIIESIHIGNSNLTTTDDTRILTLKNDFFFRDILEGYGNLWINVQDPYSIMQLQSLDDAHFSLRSDTSTAHITIRSDGTKDALDYAELRISKGASSVTPPVRIQGYTWRHTWNGDFQLLNDYFVGVTLFEDTIISILNTLQNINLHRTTFLLDPPTLDNTIDYLLVRDDITGEIKVRSAGSITGGGGAAGGFDREVQFNDAGVFNGDLQFKLVSSLILSTPATIEVGLDRIADGAAQIDLHSEIVTTDYSAQLLRNIGANGSLLLQNKGTGTMLFRQQAAGDISFETDLIERLNIGATGIINLPIAPTLDNTQDNLLVRNSTTGNIELRSATSISGGGVTMSGAYDYITLVGQDIVRGQIDLTTDVTGALPVANNTTFTTDRILFTDATTGKPSVNGTWGALTGMALYNGLIPMMKLVNTNTSLGYNIPTSFADNRVVNIGYEAGSSNIGFSTVVGYYAGNSLALGNSFNTFIGYESGMSATAGAGLAYGNTFVGNESGGGVTTGNANLMLNGFHSSTIYSGITTGAYNIILGFYTTAMVDAHTNIFIGNNAGTNTSGNNKLVIDNSITSVALADKFIYGDMLNDDLFLNNEVTIRDVPNYATPDSVLVIGASRVISKYPIASLGGGAATSLYTASGTLFPSVVATTDGTGATFAVTLGDAFMIDYNAVGVGDLLINGSTTQLYSNTGQVLLFAPGNRILLQAGAAPEDSILLYSPAGHIVLETDVQDIRLETSGTGDIYLTTTQVGPTSNADIFITSVGDDVFISALDIIDLDATNAIRITNLPALNNTATDILVRNSTTGSIEYRQSSTLGGTDTNIANTDLTITANRILDVDSKTLTFTNVSSLNMETPLQTASIQLLAAGATVWLQGSTVNLSGGTIDFSSSNIILDAPNVYLEDLLTLNNTEDDILVRNTTTGEIQRRSAATIGGGTPAGSTGEIQFNNAGAFGADANLFWDNSTKQFVISGGPPALIIKNTGGAAALLVDRTDGFAASFVAGAGGGAFRFGNTGELAFWGQPAVEIRAGTLTGLTKIFAINGAAPLNTLFIDASGNLGLGTITFGTSAAKIMAIANGTAPTTAPADMIQLWSADVTAGQANLFARSESNNSEQLTGLAIRTTSIWTANSTTALFQITNFNRQVEAGKTYEFEAILYTTSDVAAGVKASIAGTATATSIIYEGYLMNANTIAGQARATTLNSPVAAVTAVTAAAIYIKGTIVVNAAGVIGPAFAQNVSNVTPSQVLTNSTFKITPLSN